MCHQFTQKCCEMIHGSEGNSFLIQQQKCKIFQLHGPFQNGIYTNFCEYMDNNAHLKQGIGDPRFGGGACCTSAVLI